ncbi:MAG: tetratricopeptide repeat protein [Planctomycetota bacterium]|nr:tetratricopeptide repeat protein [Planctomycetota bacterium]
MKTLVRTCAIVALTAAGCQPYWNRPAAAPAGYQTAAADPRRDTEKVRRLNEQGAALAERGQFEAAEKTLKEALAADLFYGPAHNNLGSVYFRQRKYYLAAWEFQHAAKLLPGKAQPRNNLGMVFEATGRTEAAVENYEKALAIEPGAFEPAANLARTLAQDGRKDDRTRALLEQVARTDPRPDWVAWAHDRLAAMPKPDMSLPTPK